MVTISIDTVYAELRPAGPLDITITVNGKRFAEGRVPVSAPLLFTANDCLDIGIALGSPVSLDYYDKAPFKFNGRIDQFTVKYKAVKEGGGGGCVVGRLNSKWQPVTTRGRPAGADVDVQPQPRRWDKSGRAAPIRRKPL